MTRPVAYTSAQIFDGEAWHEDAALVVEEGAVAGIVPSARTADMEIVHLGNGFIAPGFVDLQVNGGGGALFNEVPTLFLIATDLTKMQVDTNVSESDIGRVGVGNDAVFTVSSYPDRQFSGRVQQIRQAPQTVQNVVTYDVVVSVANTDLALKPGMTASIRIVTKRVDNVLRVPDQSLRYRPTARQTARPVPQQSRTSGTAANSAPSAERSQHVWILADGRPRRVPVTVGLDDDAYAEITGGDLHEGDAVIVSESAAASATPRNQTAPAGMTPLRR